MYQQRIRALYDHLSPGYRRVADFLLGNYREAAFMTAAEVGRAAQVDTTSVVRFAQRLGYPGYPELINDVQAEVKRDLRAVYEPAPEEKTPAAVFQRSLIEDRNNLDYVLLHTEPEDVMAIVKIIADAPRLFVVGEGSQAHLAEMFAMRLLSLGFNARSVPSDIVGRTVLTVGMKSGDACIGLAPTFGTPGVAVALKVARAEGLRTIAVVGSPAHQAASVAEYVLYTPARTAGIWPSITTLAALLNGLVQALTVAMGDLSAEWVLRADRLMQAYASVAREAVYPMQDLLTDYNLPKEKANDGNTDAG